MFAQTDDHKHSAVQGTTVSASGNSPFEVKQQPTKCRDPIFAVLLYVNVGIIAALAVLYGSSPFQDVDANAANDDEAVKVNYTPFINVAFIVGGVGLVLSSLALQLLICIPSILIKVALIGNIVLCFAIAAAAFYFGILIMAIFGLIGALITCCYTYCIWSRIPFATANLKTATSAVKSNCGVTFLAYIVVVAAFAWTMLWTLVMVGVQDSLQTCEQVDGVNVCSKPNYLYLFLLFVSYFFTHQVLQNTIHTTIAGVVGTWWFVPSESGFCGKAVCGSFFRTITTSFGSVCFGSLIVAIIQAIRQLVESARQNDEIGNALSCCIDCILGIIESLVEYFNKWAYVYVGLYGFGYCEAGKSVMQLFRDRGWEAVIADDIVGTVLSFLSLGAGIITAGIGVLIADQSGWFDEMIAIDENMAVFAKILCGIIGFIVGFALCAIVMGVISSAVNASIVLFAEAPAEFESNYPELSREMRSAYGEAHPGSL